jgi:hypothetical protein
MGNGELSLELPPEFQIVAPVKVTVNTQGRKITPEAQGEQDGTGQPATRPESKPEGIGVNLSVTRWFTTK